MYILTDTVAASHGQSPRNPVGKMSMHMVQKLAALDRAHTEIKDEPISSIAKSVLACLR